MKFKLFALCSLLVLGTLSTLPVQAQEEQNPEEEVVLVLIQQGDPAEEPADMVALTIPQLEQMIREMEFENDDEIVAAAVKAARQANAEDGAILLDFLPPDYFD